MLLLQKVTATLLFDMMLKAPLDSGFIGDYFDFN
jgi:hypothetical protein